MNKIKSFLSSTLFKVVFVVAVVAILISSIVKLDRKADNQHKGEVVAKVNGEAIYAADIQEKLDVLFKNMEGQKAPAINEFPEEALIALSKDVAINQEMKNRIKEAGLYKDEELRAKTQDYMERLALEQFLNDVVTQAVTEQQVRSKYDEIVKSLEGKEEVRVSHILVEDESKAKRILRSVKLNNNDKYFASIAERESIDKVSAERGGDLGYVLRDQLVKEFADVAFLLKEGAVAKTPVKTQFGWHIVKVIDKRPAEVAPYEQVSKQIHDRLAVQARQDYYNSIADGLEVEVLIETASQPVNAPTTTDEIPAEVNTEEMTEVQE